MFGIVRLFSGCIFFLCMIIVLQRTSLRRHIIYTISAAISIALIAISAFLSVENCLITFDSPQKAYEYYNWGNSNIELIVEGKYCDFVVDCKKDSNIHLIIPKTESGWKIGIGSNTRIIHKKFVDSIIIYIYQYKNTSDYFITILDTAGGELTISDDFGTTFNALEKDNDLLGKTFVTYYAHISNNLQYTVIVNGNKIEFAGQTNY